MLFLKPLLFFLLNCTIVVFLSGQSFLVTTKDSLQFWADVMASSRNPKFRMNAEIQFKNILLSSLRSMDLDSSILIPGLIVAKAPDKKFTFYTWQFEGERSLWHYGGVLKWSNGNLLVLNTERRDYLRIRKDHITSDNWYGALIYQILPKVFGANNDQYIFFGFSQNQKREKFKIIDGLRFKSDTLFFGLDDLTLKDENNESFGAARQVIRYSENASCSISFNEIENQIIYDHIMRFEDTRSGGGPVFIPDGTYESLQYIDNAWRHELQLSNTLLNEAPRDHPILDNRPKDLFGREKKE
ncbi:MAG: hypothetical protein IPM48_12620 [Saprospiraceae bacterium]|nr:hypothetical protein [Saprospiraceae bacterium]